MVEVLRAAGFRLLHEGTDDVTMRRGARWLQIPKDPDILAERFPHVLAAAGMDEATYRVLSLAAHAMVAELPSSRKIRSAPPSGRSNDGE
jgi:hypothetical protein